MRSENLLWFSWKNLWSHRLRAALTIGGVGIGIGAIVFLVSLGFGLERLVTDQVTNFQAFTLIDVPSANLKTGKINKQAIDRLKEVSHVVSIHEVVDIAGRVKLLDQNAATETVVVAVDPEYFDLAEIIPKSGKLYTKDDDRPVVINDSLRILLGFQNADEAIGKSFELELVVPEDLRSDSVEGPIAKGGNKVLVVGVTTDTQSPVAYMPLKIAVENAIVNRTSLKVRVDDQANIEVAREAIENAGFSTEYVGDTIEQIAQVFSLFRIILGGFGFVALVVAALGTFNTLSISLIERLREVGLLKTLGMRKGDIFKLFIGESMAIGTIGGILGIITGSIIGWSLNRTLLLLAQRASADAVAIYASPPILIFLVIATAIALGFLTGVYPSIRAIKTNALDALRYE